MPRAGKVVCLLKCWRWRSLFSCPCS